MCSSGMSIITRSAPFTALATSATLSPAFFALSQEAPPLRRPDGDLDAGVVEVLRVRVALRAVADDGDLLALDERQVGVFFVIDFHVGFSVKLCRMRSPRPMPDAPVRTVSRIAPGSMACRKASSFDPVPVSSMV